MVRRLEMGPVLGRGRRRRAPVRDPGGREAERAGMHYPCRLEMGVRALDNDVHVIKTEWNNGLQVDVVPRCPQACITGLHRKHTHTLYVTRIIPNAKSDFCGRFASQRAHFSIKTLSCGQFHVLDPLPRHQLCSPPQHRCIDTSYIHTYL
jgi:hypothetical protein